MCFEIGLQAQMIYKTILVFEDIWISEVVNLSAEKNGWAAFLENRQKKQTNIAVMKTEDFMNLSYL